MKESPPLVPLQSRVVVLLEAVCLLDTDAYLHLNEIIECTDIIST